MLIYGGESARRRGVPFGRATSDIDLFCTAEELTLFEAHLKDQFAPPILRIQTSFDGHSVLSCPKRDMPDWQLIEIELVDGELLEAIEALPHTATDLHGFTAAHSDQQTDCLIKQAAIDVVPNCNPKHAADLADIGFTMVGISEPYLNFFNLWRERLASRYQ